VISVALKTPIEIRLGICIHKTSLLHRPDDYIGFTPRRPPHILQKNCANVSKYINISKLITLNFLYEPKFCLTNNFGIPMSPRNALQTFSDIYRTLHNFDNLKVVFFVDQCH